MLRDDLKEIQKYVVLIEAILKRVKISIMNVDISKVPIYKVYDSVLVYRSTIAC